MSTLKEKTDETAEAVGKNLGDAFADLGSALAKGDDAGKAFLKSLLSSVGDLIIGFGTLAEAQAWATWPVVDFVKAIKGIALAIAGGAIKGYATTLAEGGVVMPKAGGTNALIAEAGQAEAVIPLDRLDRMLETAGSGSSGGGMSHIVVNLDSRALLDTIFEATRNRTVLIDGGAVV
jgi:hypothetical protein